MIDLILKILITIFTFGLNLYFDKKNKSKRKSYNMNHHPFFGRLDYYRTSVIPNIPIDNPKKKKMIIKFLDIKFKNFYVEYKDLVKYLKDRELSNVSNRVLWIQDCIKQYEYEAKANGIPKLLIRKLSMWDQGTIEWVVEVIEGIWQGNYHRRVDDKIAAELDVMLCAFAQTIVSAEKTLNTLNGELDRWIIENESI